MEDPWERFVRHTREQTVRGMAQSAIVVSFLPGGSDKADIQYAVELGFSILMDKPILVVTVPGTEIPERLRRVADLIVETDIDTEEGQERLQKALNEMNERFGKGK